MHSTFKNVINNPTLSWRVLAESITRKNKKVLTIELLCETGTVTADVYEDIWELIVSEGSRFRMKYDSDTKPALLITYNGAAVRYNPEIDMYSEQILKVLDTVEPKDKYLALAEYRLDCDKISDSGKNIECLVETINKTCDDSFSAEFIISLFYSQIDKELFPDDSRLASIVHYMEYPDLLKAMIGITHVKMTSDYTFGPVDTLLRLGYDIHQLEYYVYKEISFRLLKSEIGLPLTA